MDFGDFITLILFLVFIVSSFLKRKKTQKSGESKQSGFSVLGKIREALKEAAREMEAQPEQARKKEVSGQEKRPGELKNCSFDQAGEKSVDQTFWDEIDDRNDVDVYSDDMAAPVLEQIDPVNEKTRFVFAKKEFHGQALRIPETRDADPLTQESSGHDAIQTSCIRSGIYRLPARYRGLQKAVIWSEILGKPIALRD